MLKLNLKTTKEVKVPKQIIQQVIGQEETVDIVKKVAKQRRHLLLIGQPGVGKSLVGQALAELLPKEKLVDVLSLPNQDDENQPHIRTVKSGQGIQIIANARSQSSGSFKGMNILFIFLIIVAAVMPWWIRNEYGDIMAAASLIGSMIFIAAFVIFFNLNKRMRIGSKTLVPKLLVNNADTKKAPFLDGTGAHAGALLGDVLHDPLQSGGLGTPAYERVIPGLIHRANGGVLFIDEIGNLQPHSQQELLTAMQEKKYQITGQSERSSGAMVRTDPAPTDFILVAAGTLETIKKMHPALRSRIRGYGYEMYMNDTMSDSIEHQRNLVRFIAQEVIKDKKIPHFTKDAVLQIIQEAKKASGMAEKLTVRLRELGGLIRAAGDIALEDNSKVVQRKHVIAAKKIARPLEQQLADKYIENKKKYQVIITKGKLVGRVNGLAVIGGAGTYSGVVLPIESEVTPGGKKAEFIATGKLGQIAKEAVKNVSAIIMKYFGEDIREKNDIYTQFLQTTEGVEGDSASVAVACSIISALKNIPVRQDTAMTGSLSIRGEVLAVGGVTAKVEAAINAGISRVIVPQANENDILLSKEDAKKVKIIPVKRINEVLKQALDWKGKEKILKKIK